MDGLKIRTDYPAGAAASQSGIEVFFHAYFIDPNDYFKKVATISTNGNGYASGASMIVDTSDADKTGIAQPKS